MDISRKEFLKSLALVGAGVGLVGAAGCGSDSSTDGHGGTGGGGGTATGGTGGSATGGTGGGSGDTCAESIAGNHDAPHKVDVTSADVTAAQNKDYDIRGTASHTHTLTLSAADFATLAAGTAVTVKTHGGPAHEHDITVTCT